MEMNIQPKFEHSALELDIERLSEEILLVVERYYGVRDLTTDEGKIDYLIGRVQSSNLIFIRNRVKYNAYASANFLRWKFQRLKQKHHVEIKTAREFIKRVSTSSKMSGKPYVVVLGDGTSHYLSDILKNELDALEFHLKRYRKLAERAREESASSDKADAQVPLESVVQDGSSSATAASSAETPNSNG